MVKSLKGISLVEVLIALLLFSVAMLGSGLTALKSLNFAREGLYQTKAIDLVQTQQETILARGLEGSDIASWQNRVKTILPAGRGDVRYTKGLDLNSAFINIEISWKPSAVKGQTRRVFSVEFLYRS